MGKNLKDLLKTGVFGVMSNGKYFVVIGDHFVYQEGGFDDVASANSDLELMYYKVDKLVETISFNSAKTCVEHSRNVIYDRNAEPKTFKVVCVEQKRNEKYFTVGKVYTWVDDTLICDDGFKYTECMVGGCDPDQWGLSNYYKFIKLI